MNAIHRLKIVVASLSPQDITTTLIPYLETLIKHEDDEVHFALAEELGNVNIFKSQNDKTIFLPLLESLCKSDETVVREQACASIINISKHLSEAEHQN